MSQSLYRVLKAKNPDCQITVMAPDWVTPLLSFMPELANLVLKQDWQVWIFGSANDSKVAREILFAIEDNFANQVSNLVGKTSLAQAVDLMSLTSVVVSNDSGLMHVAAALSKPVVGLYGSTSPEFTPPLAENTKLFSTDIECRPCFKRECRYGHLRCLKEIKAEEVTEAVTSLNFR